MSDDHGSPQGEIPVLPSEGPRPPLRPATSLQGGPSSPNSWGSQRCPISVPGRRQGLEDTASTDRAPRSPLRPLPALCHLGPARSLPWPNSFLTASPLTLSVHHPVCLTEDPASQRPDTLRLRGTQQPRGTPHAAARPPGAGGKRGLPITLTSPSPCKAALGLLRQALAVLTQECDTPRSVVSGQ